MCSPRIASCITADQPMLFDESARPTAVAGTGLRPVHPLVTVASIGRQATVILANRLGSVSLRSLILGVVTLAPGPFRFLLRGALAGPACPPKRI
jgi:hypothetical protein